MTLVGINDKQRLTRAQHLLNVALRDPIHWKHHAWVVFQCKHFLCQKRIANCTMQHILLLPTQSNPIPLGWVGHQISAKLPLLSCANMVYAPYTMRNDDSMMCMACHRGWQLHCQKCYWKCMPVSSKQEKRAEERVASPSKKGTYAALCSLL